MADSTAPRTLVEAIRHFADPEVSHNLLVELRWPSGVHCPICGSFDVRYIATRRLWECKDRHAGRQFSAKKGTIFEDSPLGLDVWFAVIWMIANCKNGISSYEFARATGITQKSAWFVLHRVRLAMKAGSIIKLDGEVEADESFIGGLFREYAKAKRTKIKGTGGAGKAAVTGILRRTDKRGSSKIKTQHVPNVRAETLHKEIHKTVELGSHLFTAAWVGYRGLSADYYHQVIDHSVEYVRGTVHTNGAENFWSLLKRTIKGTYVSVEPFPGPLLG